jgi:asparagine synthase (glutamine-hydrolysing)
MVLGATEPKSGLDDLAATPEGISFFEKMMYLDLITYLPGDILAKVDRASMATSLEGRIPFLDPEIVKFAWRLPHSFKVKGRTGKQILRNLVYRHVPRSLMDRRKTGFAIPVAEWLRAPPLRAWADSLLQTEYLESEGLAAEPIIRMWEEHLTGKRNWYRLIWPTVLYLAWKRDFKYR